MRFNVEKLKAIAIPMSQEDKDAMAYREENADWLRLSAAIALKVRKELRLRGMSQADFAEQLGIAPEQVRVLLSGKANLDLKTLAKMQSCLGVPLLDTSPFPANPDGAACK